MPEDVNANAGLQEARGQSGSSFWLISGLVILALFAGYWLFLRTTYVPVLVNLDPQDASEVAKVLDAKKIVYRFEAQGGTIAVPEAEADKARVELAGSELPMKGQIGFELFNQSDMGLTEFAQKVNYQRALQGELARTILMLDGIQSVRVHLGLPERSLFRGEQEKPKAAVTLILKPGKSLSSAQVSGIQRLVSGAIPEMPLEAVAVLDGTGKLVSPDTPVVLPEASSSLSDQRIETARAKIVSELAAKFPGQAIGVGVSLRYAGTNDDKQRPSPAASQEADASSALLPRGNPDFAYAVRLSTEQPLSEEQRGAIAAVVAAALRLDQKRGDSLAFEVGPVVQQNQVGAASNNPDRIVAQAKEPQKDQPSVAWDLAWIIAVAAAVAAALIAIIIGWRKMRTRRLDELNGFAAILKQRLGAEEGA